MILKLNSILITFSLLFQIKGYNAQKKDCNFGIMEKHFNSLFGFFGYPEHKWPENDREMNKWCRAVQRDSVLGKNFLTNCTKGMARTIPSVVIFTTTKLAKVSCRNKRERNNYMSKAKCGNKGKTATTKCWNELIAIMTNIKNLKDDKDKIPSMCCTFFTFKDCALNAFRKLGPPVCTETHIELMEQQIDKGMVDAMNVLCSDYQDSDRCTKFVAMFDRKQPPVKWKTPFPAVIEILESIR